MGIRFGVALALLVLAGCGNGGSGGGTGSTGRTAPHLDGTSWIGTKASVDGADRAFVAGSTVRAEFAGGTLSVYAGCNHLHGDYRLSGDRLTVGPLASTEMACEPPLMEQDAWLSGTVLAAPLTARVDGDTLTLSRPGLELVLTDRRVASPDVPLQGTDWRLEATREGDAFSTVPHGVRATLRIGRDGTVRVDTGCNGGGGTASVEGPTITFGPLVTTLMACSDARGQVEAAVTAVLDGTVRWSVTEQTLTLTKGDRGLVYRVAP